MKANELIKGLSCIPNVAEYVFTDDNFDSIVWLTDGAKPTLSEVEAAYQLYLTNQIQTSETKAAARQALLDKLGITQEEAQLLLGGN